MLKRLRKSFRKRNKFSINSSTCLALMSLFFFLFLFNVFSAGVGDFRSFTKPMLASFLFPSSAFFCLPQESLSLSLSFFLSFFSLTHTHNNNTSLTEIASTETHCCTPAARGSQTASGWVDDPSKTTVDGPCDGQTAQPARSSVYERRDELVFIISSFCPSWFLFLNF